MKTIKVNDSVYKALDREAKKRKLTADEYGEITLKRELKM